MTAAFFVSLVNICYLWKFRPFEDTKVLNLEIMNEATNFVLLYHVMCFAGLVPAAEDRYMLGWSFILVLVMNMLVHFSLLVKETFLSCKEDCKKKCRPKPTYEEQY